MQHQCSEMVLFTNLGVAGTGGFQYKSLSAFSVKLSLGLLRAAGKYVKTNKGMVLSEVALSVCLQVTGA